MTGYVSAAILPDLSFWPVAELGQGQSVDPFRHGGGGKRNHDLVADKSCKR